WPIWPTTSTASSSTKSAQPRHESARMTGKRRQWAPPIAKRRAKSAQTRKSDGHNRSRRLSEPVFAGLQLGAHTPKNEGETQTLDRNIRHKPKLRGGSLLNGKPGSLLGGNQQSGQSEVRHRRLTEACNTLVLSSSAQVP